MCSTCGCKSAETGKKNCGCGQDPCKTYGAETFDADSLKGRWDEGTTRIIHGVSVTKTRYGGEMWEKPQYRCDYNGYSCRIFYEGVAFYLPCWMYRGYGGVGRQGCFKNPMEAILDFKMRAEGGFQKSHSKGTYKTETKKSFWDDIDSPKKLARMQRNYEKLSNSLYEPTMDYNEIVESKLEKFPSTVDYYGIKFKGGGHAITTTKNKTLAPKLKKDAEYHRDSKGRFTEKPILTGSVVGGLALGLIYLMRGK